MLRYLKRGDSLRTLYIDVYFLINLTVDMLSIYLSFKFMHLHISNKRWFLTSVASAACAIVYLFINHNNIYSVFYYALFTALFAIVSVKGASFICRLKLTALFYVFSFTIGGAVSFVYEALDGGFKNFKLEEEKAENNKILFFSLIILLIIGVFRILINVFSGSLTQRSVKIRIKFMRKALDVDALVDSGNLVKDPMNMQPVVFLKQKAAAEILPTEAMAISGIASLDYDLQKRMRLIPVSRGNETHIMTGVRVDEIYLVKEKERLVRFDATVVIDKEGGTFGGCEALIPYIPFYDDL